MISSDTIKNLVGKTFDFYGATEDQFKLGSTVYEAIEDPDDGYRSYLGSVEVVDSKAIFFNQPLAEVTVLSVDEVNGNGAFEGYKLVDTHDGHVWLVFGTENTDDYYPWFTFKYLPKEPKQ